VEAPRSGAGAVEVHAVNARAIERAFAVASVDVDSLVIRFERAAEPGCGAVAGKPGRFYTLRIERGKQIPLAGVGAEPGFDLVIQRGSLNGKRTTVRREEFKTLARAIEVWGARCARRRANGYREIPRES
jgi:hypothetical protein